MLRYVHCSIIGLIISVCTVVLRLAYQLFSIKSMFQSASSFQSSSFRC